MIELKNITKSYFMGRDVVVHALSDINLSISEGDFVAIMGPSGSGKSTLMHILGLLDIPTSGTYKIKDKDITGLNEDDLAILRRKVIGFIFQQFNLLPRTTARENVSLPLLFSKRITKSSKADELLSKVGLHSRASHLSNELSGGQQQRVAIARALINNPSLIMADEPTGNLDSKSEEDVIQILRDLNNQGMTVILVTHEEKVASHAKRIIRLQDGKITSDIRTAPYTPPSIKESIETTNKIHFLHILKYFSIGIKTLLSNKVRTFLSTLGILIGVAAVVTIMALGVGAQESIRDQLSNLGANLLILSPGYGQRGVRSGGTRIRLRLNDVPYLKNRIANIKYIAPKVESYTITTYNNKNWNTSIIGSTPIYEVAKNSTPSKGRFFTDIENSSRKRVVVIGNNVAKELFDSEEPIGKIVRIDKNPFQVIGVLPAKGALGFQNLDDSIIMPIMTAMYRVLGKNRIDTIEIFADNSANLKAVETNVLNAMYRRHKVPEKLREGAFYIFNMASIQESTEKTTRTITILLSFIAAISLFVGGIGIMNIMLVSVTERTREIGLKKAIGAKRIDIMIQFLIESILVSFSGGFLGLILAFSITKIIKIFTAWQAPIELGAVLLSFIFSVSMGIIFGLYPAMKAAKLAPIEALRYE